MDIIPYGVSEKSILPQYSLIGVDFDSNTRNARILIVQRREYRTIERYVTRNYSRIPIYSSWKVKEKTIKKSLKLTNKVLENLENNEDELIRLLANDIVLSLNNKDLYPSWFVIKSLQSDLKRDYQKMAEEKEAFLIKKEQMLLEKKA